MSWGTGSHGDNNPFDGTNGVLAHAYSPMPDGGSLTGDIHFDDDEAWTVQVRPAFSGQPIDLVTVAAHEIGHALGLGHSNVECALMNPWYTGSHRYLAQDDIDGIQSIYGNRTVVRSNNLDCSGGTFFINNLPAGATVFWESSNVSIATVSNVNNQGIVTWLGSTSGNIRITGTITLPCGSTVVEFKDIFLGTLTPTLMVDAVDWCPGTSYVASALAPSNLPTPYHFEWYVNGVFKSGITGPVLKGKFDLSDNRIEVRIVNNCGPSAFAMRDGWCPEAMSTLVYPNPGEEQVSVETNDQRDIQEVKVIDSYGAVKKTYSYSGRTNKVTFSVAALPANVYYIQIYDGKIWETLRFVKDK